MRVCLYSGLYLSVLLLWCDDDAGPTLSEWEASAGDCGDESHPARTRIHGKWIRQHVEKVSVVDVRARMDCHLLTLVILRGKKAIRWEVHLYRGRVCLLGRRERLASGVAVPFSYFYFTVFRKMKKTNKRNKTKQKKTKSVYYELMMHVLYEKNLLWVRQIFFCCLCQICFVCLRVCSVLGV